MRSALDAVLGVIAQRDAAGPVAVDADEQDSTSRSEHTAPAEQGHHAADIAGASAAGLFDPILGDAKLVALLLDGDGLVSAGQYMTSSGRDLGSEIGAHLTGVSDEAERAMRHFKLGKWTRLAIETEAATIAIAPMGKMSLLIAASRDVPLGFVRRTLDRCVVVARDWLGEGA